MGNRSDNERPEAKRQEATMQPAKQEAEKAAQQNQSTGDSNVVECGACASVTPQCCAMNDEAANGVLAVGRVWHCTREDRRCAGEQQPKGESGVEIAKVTDNLIPRHQRTFTCDVNRPWPKCSGTNCGRREIEGTCYIALDRFWHPGCFCCASCGDRLEREHFYTNDGGSTTQQLAGQGHSSRCYDWRQCLRCSRPSVKLPVLPSMLCPIAVASSIVAAAAVSTSNSTTSDWLLPLLAPPVVAGLVYCLISLRSDPSSIGESCESPVSGRSANEKPAPTPCCVADENCNCCSGIGCWGCEECGQRVATGRYYYFAEGKPNKETVAPDSLHTAIGSDDAKNAADETKPQQKQKVQQDEQGKLMTIVNVVMDCLFK